MKAETPARGVSTTTNMNGLTCYHISCDCHSVNHAVDTWITVEQLFDDTEEISVIFNVNTYTHPFARGFWQRVKNACKVLMGIDEQSHEIIVNQQTAKNWISAVEKTIDDFNKQKSA